MGQCLKDGKEAWRERRVCWTTMKPLDPLDRHAACGNRIDHCITEARCGSLLEILCLLERGCFSPKNRSAPLCPSPRKPLLLLSCETVKMCTPAAANHPRGCWSPTMIAFRLTVSFPSGWEDDDVSVRPRILRFQGESYPAAQLLPRKQLRDR